MVLNITGSLCFFFLDIPTPQRRTAETSSARPLGVIFRQPKTLVAITCAMVTYSLMSLVMTSTSLAMHGTGFTTNHAADVVRWHVVAMFLPSFFTGSLILRFGHLSVMTFGLILLGVSGMIAFSGTGLVHFYLALIALGLGWNFGFIGATSLLGTTHTQEERSKVQGLNDFLVFGLVTVASFSSGALLYGYGWATVQLAMVPVLALAFTALLWLTVSSRRRHVV